MDIDQAKGRIRSAEVRRQACVDYAVAIMPVLRMGVGANRKANGSFNMSAIARWLNDREYPTPTGKGVFVSETVSRVLFKTEDTIADFAKIERDTSIWLFSKTHPRGDVKAETVRLEIVHDQTVAMGKALGRQLRCEDLAPVVRMTLEEAARLVMYQADYRGRHKRWDENREYGLGESFEAWSGRVLREALEE